MKVKIVKEVKRSDGLWRFACGDVFVLKLFCIFFAQICIMLVGWGELRMQFTPLDCPSTNPAFTCSVRRKLGGLILCFFVVTNLCIFATFLHKFASCLRRVTDAVHACDSTWLAEHASFHMICQTEGGWAAVSHLEGASKLFWDVFHHL